MPYRPIFEPHVAEYIGCDLPGNELADHFVLPNGTADAPTGAFDVVLSAQVLEHVADTKLYLSEAHRVLAENGLLLLSTHGTWRYHPDPLDLWRWTCDGLHRVITDAGFSITERVGVMGPAATGLQIWQDAVLPAVPKPLRTIFTAGIQSAIGIADRRCPDEIRNRDACVYLMVARRNGESA